MWKPANLRNPLGLASPNHPHNGQGGFGALPRFPPGNDTGHWRGSNDLLKIPVQNCLRGHPGGRVREVTICRKLPCALSAATRRVSTGAVECGWMGCGKKSFHKVLQFPVEKFFFLHILLWINFPCLSKTKPSFPHKFPLLLLLLPKIFTFIFIIHYFTEMRSYHALYL